MTRETSDKIHHDPNAAAVHIVNSQLLEKLFGDDGCLRALVFDKSAWIINVLYLHGFSDTSQILKTSSTLHKGTLYDHRIDRHGDVLSIDETVPLATSVSGRCVLSGRPIWLGAADLGSRRDGFGEKYYRRFSLVDVKTAGYKIPRAEIVFPIATQQLNATTTLGALNLELFGDGPWDSDKFIVDIPRESINELLSDVLHIHSGFLKIAVDILNLSFFDRPPDDDSSEMAADACSSVEQLATAHRYVIERFINHNQEAVNEISHAVSIVAERLTINARNEAGDA
jgi:hypothetical protein